MKNKLSRMEANKVVRQVLSRNGVDLSYTQYSVAGKDVRLTGWLCRTDGLDLSATKIENMIMEFARFLPGYSITGDFDNWNFSTDHINYLGEKQPGEEGTEEGSEESMDCEEAS